MRTKTLHLLLHKTLIISQEDENKYFTVSFPEIMRSLSLWPQQLESRKSQAEQHLCLFRLCSLWRRWWCLCLLNAWLLWCWASRLISSSRLWFFRTSTLMSIVGVLKCCCGWLSRYCCFARRVSRSSSSLSNAMSSDQPARNENLEGQDHNVKCAHSKLQVQFWCDSWGTLRSLSPQGCCCTTKSFLLLTYFCTFFREDRKPCSDRTGHSLHLSHPIWWSSHAHTSFWNRHR